ncbi:HEAT repeat domain-containing protein [Prochlorococcus marinus]|uniref:Bilin biosynthesis protein CpeY n=1 Tax=Prochlorococcus marinus XMU1408 TaxID=2213228 RepID=A0A318R497_PROMR|nr:HEAT repeat domain-containing protein [Prochlorococcus marinus]MBW3041367.1 bilin biosynthesis protein CpeY [Prochlorococcus marinus str. XMU1408]PYE02532.1 bilin biosynthesis protein CpeY [Prochlorococcus marinus XMU1408]
MQSNPFNNLPKINKRDAINILRKPITEVKFLADYYKAVFHLFNFPSEESERVLIDFIKYDYEKLEYKIAKRKAIEVLANFDCKKAIPIIAEFLKNDDDEYLLETAIWSLGKLKCNDINVINKICSLLYKQFNNKRLVIQTLTNLGVKQEIDKIRSLSIEKQSSNGVKGASIAALIKLSGEVDKVSDLTNFLQSSNQNDRHCAVQDIINAGHLSVLPCLVKAPISPSFKLKAIDSLWSNEILYWKNINLIESLDLVIIDNPKIINTLGINNFKKDLVFLIDQLFHTDFNRCYQSMKELDKFPADEVLYYLNKNWDRAKSDYGALYFFANAYKLLIDKKLSDNSILEKVEFLLSDSWPNYMKFKSSAIQILGYLNDNKFYNNIEVFSDEKLTPYWKNRYAALLVLQNKQIHIKKGFAKLFLNDSHRFIRLKAKEISLT